MDEELIEKVRKAVHAAMRKDLDSSKLHRVSVPAARAAIQAMMDAGWQPPMTEARREEVVKKISAVYDEGLKSFTRNITG